jgi:hypothetical protein
MSSVTTRRNWLFYRCTTLLFLVGFFSCAPAIRAQTPSAVVTGSSEKSQEGFTPGWGFGTKFEGSTSGDGTVTDLATGVGYNFTRHFGVDLGVPYYFISTPSSIKQKNPGAVSGVGIGSLSMNLKWNYPSKLLNYAPTVHFGAPTGDEKKGLSVGHATWNFVNHVDHAFGDFSPFVNAGVGNSVMDTKFFQRPFMTFGYNLHSEAGVEYDPGNFSFTASAYDVAPWGNQVMISRVFRCGSATKCSAAGTSTDRKSYKSASVTAGVADLTRDNGFNAGIEVKPARYLDLEADYSRSVPLQLNNLSFGISVDISSLLRPQPHH